MSERELAIRLGHVDIGYDAGPVVKDVSLEVLAHEIHVLLGESGSGKTTILRAIAGFETISAGTIELFGEIVDRGGQRGAYRPPEKRGAGVVFQDYALFPHLDVAGNVAFGMRERSGPRVEALLEEVGLRGMGKRSVAELSGGQQQRVALARALAQTPRIILLDEPFSNLNRELRDELRERTVRLLRAERMTAIFVTHDRHEAFAMADRISVIGQGRVLQTGTAAEIYELPVSEAVARSVGDVNFLGAEVDESGAWASSELGRIELRKPMATGMLCRILVRPGQLTLGRAQGSDGGPGPDAWATVEEVIYFGAWDEARLVLDSGSRLVAHTLPGQVSARDRVLVSVRGAVACVP